MSLMKYFSCEKTKDSLLDPSGSLNEAVPSSSIEEANKEVNAQLALVDYSGKKRRAIYMIATLEQKAKIGNYATENGTTKAIRHFAKDIPRLKESTVRGWKTIYLRELAAKVKAGEEDLCRIFNCCMRHDLITLIIHNYSCRYSHASTVQLNLNLMLACTVPVFIITCIT